MDDLKRFIKYVSVLSNGCWEWQGAIDKDGYGFFTLDKLMKAHRASYQLFKGKLIDGMHIDHLCRNRPCVNPDHLEQVSPQVNTLRSPIARAAINSRKTHCYKGHEFTPINTGYVNEGRERYCRECVNNNKRIRRSVVKEPRQPSTTHCSYMHELVAPNLGFSKSGEWFCKRCVADRQKRYKMRRKLNVIDNNQI